MNITLDVSVLAKWKTTIQIIACSTYLVWRSHSFFSESKLFLFYQFLIWIAGIITIITCYDYLKKYGIIYRILINMIIKYFSWVKEL